ncbi:hypothetical protein LXM25_11280 [Dyadobacter sp. LJ53]|uniref:hypothetical protein n=1 Tax=Dyadobacter chenwenxiniae TaxID=2906456 RepID=UPI001F473D56|nr:hypothetical protein [Dyadobacter chenwenxiniae]MCF0050646.1 hypothetical protein [Dyadobacter chenwenxiniae]
MSDQEPESKRMIDQLWEYTEPYRPGAWEHFERLRDKQKRKRRVVIFWLNAAAVLVFFGTAILVYQLMHRGKTAENATAVNQVRNDRVSGKESLEKLSSSANTGGVKYSLDLGQVNRKKERIAAGTRSVQSFKKGSLIRMSEYQLANEIAMADQTKKQELASPNFLQSRPFRGQNVHFSKLYIPISQQHSESATRLPDHIRFGLTVSQQSNQAAGTRPELNYGIGGALYFPVTRKIAFVTGTSASKQSLHVEKDIVASTPLNGLPQLERARYQWFNVEVPMHMQYSLKTFKKAAITAVGGFSVLGSVGQISDYLYKTSRTITTVTETTGGPVVVSTQTVEDFSSVTENNKKGSWVFGGALYFGLGFNYQMKNYGLGIEPYVKYPIGPVTAEKLQLTSLGVQLRLTGLISKPR